MNEAIFESDHGALNINGKTLLSMDSSVYIDLENCVFIREVNYVLVHKVKGKAVPLQAWSDPEVSRKLRFPDFMTAQDGGKVVSLTHWPPLPPGNTPGTHFC